MGRYATQPLDTVKTRYDDNIPTGPGYLANYEEDAIFGG